MIRAKTEKGTVLLGIDKENVKRLKEGKPIYVKGDSIGIENDICIAYGDSLQDIAEEFGLTTVQ